MKKKTLIYSLFIFVSFLSLISLSCGDKHRDGKAIYINVGSEPRSIDPALNNAVDGSIYIQHAFEGLATRDKNNKIIGGVAESWDISEDGLTYTFHLRENAKWADGQKITADDFVYAWRRAVDPLTAAEYAYQYEPVLNAMDINAGKKPLESLGVKAIDENTLEVKLATPTAYFIELAAFPTFYPIRKDIIENTNTSF